MPRKSVAPRRRPAESPALDWSRYRHNLPRHLIGISREIQSGVLHALSERDGFSDLRPSFGPLLSLLSPGRDERSAKNASEARPPGRPLGVVARELAISKQACSQLAELIERAGYLERLPNRLDGRSRVLVLTKKGSALVEAARQEIASIQAGYAARIGLPAFERFAKALMALYDDFGFPVTAGSQATIAVLPLIVDRLQQRVMEETMAKGHPDLKRSYAQILLLIGPEGGRVAEMARLQNVSRQAVSAVSLEIEGLGYVRRGIDPLDGRGKVIELTASGRALIADSVETVREIEASLRERLGEGAFDALEQVALELYRELGLEKTIFDPNRDRDQNRSAWLERAGDAKNPGSKPGIR